MIDETTILIANEKNYPFPIDRLLEGDHNEVILLATFPKLGLQANIITNRLSHLYPVIQSH